MYATERYKNSGNYRVVLRARIPLTIWSRHFCHPNWVILCYYDLCASKMVSASLLRNGLRMTVVFSHIHITHTDKRWRKKKLSAGSRLSTSSLQWRQKNRCSVIRAAFENKTQPIDKVTHAVEFSAAPRRTAIKDRTCVIYIYRFDLSITSRFSTIPYHFALCSAFADTDIF